jgi:hypothetical protein
MRKLMEAKLRREERALLPEPMPDFDGWSVAQILMWTARNGKFEEVVAEANAGQVKTMVTPEEREAELRAAGKWPEEPALPTAPASMEPAQIAEAAAPAKTPQQAWMEELCGWRHRGPEDYYWGDAGNDTASVGYECLYKYDVLERAWGPLPWER